MSDKYVDQIQALEAEVLHLAEAQRPHIDALNEIDSRKRAIWKQIEDVRQAARESRGATGHALSPEQLADEALALYGADVLGIALDEAI